jgi:hypothetical protein
MGLDRARSADYHVSMHACWAEICPAGEGLLVNKCFYVIVILAVAPILRVPAFAQALRFDAFDRGQREITLLVGCGENHRWPEANKDIFSFDVAAIRYGYFISRRNEGAVALSYGRPNAPGGNFAITATASYRHYFLIRGNTAAGCDLSLGATRFDSRMSSLGTKANFTEQLGLCFHHALSPKSAITVEYKFSHTSNAGLKLPNIGINASLIAVGFSYYPGATQRR